MSSVAYQYSAGGIVADGGRVLMIRTRTLRGRTVWTFPKGRLEKGERHWEAALREVHEETGYLCRLKSRLGPTSFWFRRDATRVRKTVQWFLLEPLRRAGPPDPREVDEVRWVPVREAYAKLSYASDRRLLAGVEEEGLLEG